MILRERRDADLGFSANTGRKSAPLGTAACSQAERFTTPTKPSSAGSSGASTCLCYHFGPDGLSVAKKTVENFVERALRLYEQEPGEALASARLGLYVRRWVRWAGGAVTEPSVLTNNP